MRRLLSVIVAFVLLSGVVFAASMTNDQLVAARVAAMKQDGAVLRGAKSLSGQAAIDAATTVLKNFTKFPSLFPPGSITEKSRATEKIWQNWPDFLARLNAEKQRAQAMLAAAKSGDKAAYQKAVADLTAACSNCHLAYARVF